MISLSLRSIEVGIPASCLRGERNPRPGRTILRTTQHWVDRDPSDPKIHILSPASSASFQATVTLYANKQPLCRDRLPISPSFGARPYSLVHAEPLNLFSHLGAA